MRLFFLTLVLTLGLSPAYAEDAATTLTKTGPEFELGVPIPPNLPEGGSLTINVTVALEPELIADMLNMIGTLEEDLFIANDELATMSARVEVLENFFGAFARYCAEKPDGDFCAPLAAVMMPAE